MRTRWFFVLAAVSLLAAQNSPAQLHISGIRLGYIDPKDSKAGLMLGVDLTGKVDESVELGAAVNVFRRNYQKTISSTAKKSGVSTAASPGWPAAACASACGEINGNALDTG